jgi:hypothetical protein
MEKKGSLSAAFFVAGSSAALLHGNGILLTQQIKHRRKIFIFMNTG